MEILHAVWLKSGGLSLLDLKLAGLIPSVSPAPTPLIFTHWNEKCEELV